MDHDIYCELYYETLRLLSFITGSKNIPCGDLDIKYLIEGSLNNIEKSIYKIKEGE